MTDEKSSSAVAPLTLATLPDVCSPEQAAEALGVHVKTVRAACRRGELRAARLGTLWRIRAVDVRELFGAAAAGGDTLPDRVPRLGRPGRPRKRRRSPVAVATSPSSELAATT